MKFYSMPSPAQDSRIRNLVLHYTATGIKTSIQRLAGNDAQVSAHYLISDTPERTGEIPVYELVKPEERAWHAGNGSWQKVNNLDCSSIGIEIVNPGFMKDKALAERRNSMMVYQPPRVAHRPPPYQDSQGNNWFHFPKEQIALLIELAVPLVKKYKIEPTRVVGQADIAPGRNQDPGPLFPWYTLAHEEIGAWPRAAVVEYYENRLKERSLTLRDQQNALKAYGYDVPTNGILDLETKNTIESFQMHFAPTDYLRNMPDISQAVLCALLEDYCPKDRDTILGERFPPSGVNGPAVNSQQFLESIHPTVDDTWEIELGAQLYLLGVSGTEVNSRVSHAKKTNSLQKFFECIASDSEDEAVTNHPTVTASKDQLFKPAGLGQLLTLT